MQYFPDLRREANAPQGLVFAQGEEWRTARHTLSPTFSAAKMKAVSRLVSIRCENVSTHEWLLCVDGPSHHGQCRHPGEGDGQVCRLREECRCFCVSNIATEANNESVPSGLCTVYCLQTLWPIYSGDHNGHSIWTHCGFTTWGK